MITIPISKVLLWAFLTGGSVFVGFILAAVLFYPKDITPLRGFFGFAVVFILVVLWQLTVEGLIKWS